MNDFLHFTEREEYPISEYNTLVTTIQKTPSIISMHGNTFSFCITGFLVCNNCLVIIFPKKYLRPSNQNCLQQEARLLLNTLLRYRAERNHNPEELEFLEGNNTNTSNRIVSAISLITDFQSNGYLHRSIKMKTSKASGYIDWAETIHKTIPYLNHGQALYPTPIIRKSSTDIDNIIIKIHKAVLQQSISLWGWLLDCTIPFNENFEMPCGESEALNLLQGELHHTYVQREINVINNLILFIKNKADGSNSIKLDLIATPYFQYVWESICGHIFENQYSFLSHIIPKPEWTSEIVKSKLSQRPDILFRNSNNLFILDAKYYDYQHSTPGWHDIVKQMFYLYTIKKILNDTDYPELKEISCIFSAFILPENSEHKITYLGKVHVNKVEDLGCIEVFAINTHDAMHAYATGKASTLKQDVLLKLTSI